ncbi:unnamed protein product [Psylliodes chrysocephalus]|uniref:NADP-dependent oxidoreductase domain-containing protein n=1 Tax=Psylliodes chrysocephalus TaxID=3402493 RepID=A0A9P0G974_9CUCU|nr:unnamed protein product [Psylliodes chrysocephala]
MARSQNCGGLAMPSVGLGTWEARDDAEIVTALNAALELGYRHIDTAFAYENERTVGKVLNEWINSGKIEQRRIIRNYQATDQGNSSRQSGKIYKDVFGQPWFGLCRSLSNSLSDRDG